jgi:NAD(P)-dependent dehydrogenase (short-subunit alcohol dehydrogenase family)
MSAPYLIMGARGGIGEAIARRLIASGYNVAGTMREGGDAPQGIPMHIHDITDAQNIVNIVSALDTGEGLSGLAYCIGSIDIAPLKNASDQKFMDAFEVNVMGAVRALRAAESALRKGRGSVVLFSSIAAGQGFPNHAAIGTAKAAVEGLMRSVAAEWAPDVRVNCIAPSLTETPLAAKFTSNEKIAQAIAKAHPIPRLGQAEDAAALGEFLLLPESGWMTGEAFHLDGGRSHLRVKD